MGPQPDTRDKPFFMLLVLNFSSSKTNQCYAGSSALFHRLPCKCTLLLYHGTPCLYQTIEVLTYLVYQNKTSLVF